MHEFRGTAEMNLGICMSLTNVAFCGHGQVHMKNELFLIVNINTRITRKQVESNGIFLSSMRTV